MNALFSDGTASRRTWASALVWGASGLLLLSVATVLFHNRDDADFWRACSAIAIGTLGSGCLVVTMARVLARLVAVMRRGEAGRSGLDLALYRSPLYAMVVLGYTSVQLASGVGIAVTSVLLALCFLPALLYVVLVYSLDPFEQEPWTLVWRVFSWGVGLALPSALWLEGSLGSWATGTDVTAEYASSYQTAVVVAPLVEEALKGLALLALLLHYRSEIDSVTDGALYGAVVGLGFAALENVVYLAHGWQVAGAEGLLSLFVTRVVLLAWLHPAAAAMTGIGFAVARLATSWSWRIAAPLLGLVGATTLHASHNALALATGRAATLAPAPLIALDWIPWLLIVCAVVIMQARQAAQLREHLRQEIDEGLLTLVEVEEAASCLRRTRSAAAALVSGRYRVVVRRHQLCGILARKRALWARQREDPQLGAAISGLRSELARA